MANEISILNNFVINQFALDNLVNTISEVPTTEIDANKENIYPLVNIDMTTSEVEDQVLIVYYTITINKQRDIRPVKTDSKLLADTNYSDNINETHTIAQRFINFLTRQNNDEIIEIFELGSLTILNGGDGGLDGVRFLIQLSIPNVGEAC